MRSRWFHVPRLHADTGHHGKKVSWLELFYDLIFVAAIIQLGNFLSDNVSLAGFTLFAGHFVPLWMAWTGFTFYANRFDVDDIFHRVLVFAQMFAVGTMAISAPTAMEGKPAIFAGSFAVAQAILAGMYLRAWRQLPGCSEYARFWAMMFGLGAAVWAISVFVPHPWNYILWTLGVAAILYAPISRQSRALTDRYPIDFHHLSERYGLLTIIVLGESFVKVLSYFTESDLAGQLDGVLRGFFNLLLTCAIWWIYFDDVAGSNVRKQRGAWIVWLYGHLPLTLAITAVGVAVKKAIKFDTALMAPDAYRWLLAGTLALTLLSVAIIDSVTERRNAELSDRARVNARFFSALLLLLLGQAGSWMAAGPFLALVTAICGAQVVFDIMLAPFDDTPEHGVSTADLARLRMEGEGPVRRRADVSQAVRLGAPSELRRDLYFYFIEGSWTRLLLSFSFLFLFVNVFFAAVYLIDPGSIAGGRTQTFADAFFFSVQTLSTIGFGGMTPASDFGDMVVTAEAAVGMLFVALATGLMFAKASRPQSSVLFSKPLVITTRHGKPTLMFRAGNARGNEVVDATMTVTVLKEELTAEGHHLRRLHDLNLVRSRSPLFVLSWVIIHEIDESSPLYGVDWERPGGELFAVIATMTGHDGTYGQTTFARHTWYPEDVRPGHRFVDVMSELEDGRLMIDYTRFHDTELDS